MWKIEPVEIEKGMSPLYDGLEMLQQVERWREYAIRSLGVPSRILYGIDQKDEKRKKE